MKKKEGVAGRLEGCTERRNVWQVERMEGIAVEAGRQARWVRYMFIYVGWR
jgi:hypothetical protein